MVGDLVALTENGRLEIGPDLTASSRRFKTERTGPPCPRVNHKGQTEGLGHFLFEAEGGDDGQDAELHIEDARKGGLSAQGRAASRLSRGRFIDPILIVEGQIHAWRQTRHAGDGHRIEGGHEARSWVRDLGRNGHADHGLIELARRPGGQGFRAQGGESVRGSTIRVHFTVRALGPQKGRKNELAPDEENAGNRLHVVKMHISPRPRPDTRHGEGLNFRPCALPTFPLFGFSSC